MSMNFVLLMNECLFNPDKFHITHWMSKYDKIRKTQRLTTYNPPKINVYCVISNTHGIVYNMYG